MAWHGRSLNSRYVGVETEGCGPAPHAEAMTEAMVNAMGRLYAEGMRRHAWPNRDANKDGEGGLGFHRMAVATACPCDIRLNIRGEIRRRASGAAEPSPGPSGGGAMQIEAAKSGYWIVGSDGGIFAYGGAPFHGSMGGKKLNAPVVAMAAPSDDRGYWLVASDGGVFTFGRVEFHGSMGGQRLNAPVTDIVATPSGNGYWLLGRDGGVFSFGDAVFHGAPVGQIK